jgi:hypothetical protein
MPVDDLEQRLTKIAQSARSRDEDRERANQLMNAMRLAEED